MICIGYPKAVKALMVERFALERNTKRTVILSPKAYDFALDAEHVEYAEIIQYKHYYRLIQTIDNDTLVVVNECLRTQNRYDLTYNCIRNFLNQTRNVLVFQTFPLIDTIEDFMTLFDWDTQSRWKRERFSVDLLHEATVQVFNNCPPWVRPSYVETSQKTKAEYAKQKRALIDGIGLKDPHTIPRTLHMIAGKEKAAYASNTTPLVGRNNRFKLANLRTYEEVDDTRRVIFEFCHNFINFSDWLALSGYRSVAALVSDLKVDEWYLQRFSQWCERVKDAQAILREEANRARSSA